MHYKVFHDRAAAMNFADGGSDEARVSNPLFCLARRRLRDVMSRTAVPVGRPDWGTFVPASRPESADFNFGLLAALAACVAFWVLVALTVYSLN
jgi:ABC-type uncharacterized transport system permease subunit